MEKGLIYIKISKNLKSLQSDFILSGGTNLSVVSDNLGVTGSDIYTFIVYWKGIVDE